MVKNLANKAMTTKGQKACAVIDHLVEALGGDPSSSLRRALILNDIAQFSGTTQTGIMERLNIHKSAVNREIDWLFNYGCIRIQNCSEDARSKKIEVYGYAKTALEAALGYFNDDHAVLRTFLEDFAKILKSEKPTLRDAKIIAVLYEKEEASRQDIVSSLYGVVTSTDQRAYKKLVEEGLIEEDA